ncbi:FecR family protein [Sunxiuqinia rutila]|uniref:FecR family protein n=1 Tax=Sunxiuqinia rutila TaxID=1397841 RepID=UPI003D35FFEB
MNMGSGDLIRRYFNNTYSRNDYLKMRVLVDDSGLELHKQLAKHWEDYKEEDLPPRKDLSAIQQQIEQQISPKNNSKLLKRILHSYSKVAAILAIPLVLALGLLYAQFNEYLFQKDVYVEVFSPSGAHTSLSLPDGSSVWLNGESRVRYPAVFNNDRRVRVEGEAFFKVKSDVENPFFVEAREIEIKATGTEFNVLAYQDEPEIDIILKEGTVTVSDAGTELKQMQAGYLLNYRSNTRDFSYQKVDVESYADWINGKLVFENAPMPEVVKRMEHWFGVDIEIADPSLKQLHFKATFTHENLEEALKLLQLTETFSYRFVRHTEPLPDGTYEKTKVIISKR